MKKYFLFLFCMCLLVTAAACDRSAVAPEESSTPVGNGSTATTEAADSTADVTTTQESPPATDATTTTATSPAVPTSADGTTSRRTNATSPSAGQSVTTTGVTTITAAPSTTTTAAPTTTTAAPTAKPVQRVTLPGAGYDLDGKGRILVQSASVSGSTATFVLENKSGTWMTDEESTVPYTVYAADGRTLATGSLYIGMIEAKKTATVTLPLPADAARVTFGTCSLTYWGSWK